MQAKKSLLGAKSIFSRYLKTMVMAGVCAISMSSQAAEYPDKPITVLLGFPPGTSTDSVARIIGERLSKELGQPVIIKNRPGVGGSLALGELAKMKPDGYTLGLSASGPLGINPHLLKNINYDALKDFAPIGQTSWLPFLLVTNKTKGLDTFPKLVEYARNNPNQLTYASIGLGTTSHLLMEMLLQKTNLKMVHVPYTGSSQSQADVIGGNVDMTIDTLVTTLPHVKSGRLNGIAVSTSDRANLDRTIPTLQEQGVPDYNLGAWLGFVAPAGTPAPIIQRLFVEINKALTDPEIAQRLEALGTQVVMSQSPAAFATLIDKNYDTWGRLIKQLNLEQK